MVIAEAASDYWAPETWLYHWPLPLPALGLLLGGQFDLATMLPWKLSAFVVSCTSKTATEPPAEPVLPLTTSWLEHLIAEGSSCACGIVATATRESGNFQSSEFYLGDRSPLCCISPKLQKSVKNMMDSHTKEWYSSSIGVYLGPSIITADVPGHLIASHPSLLVNSAPGGWCILSKV